MARPPGGSWGGLATLRLASRPAGWYEFGLAAPITSHPHAYLIVTSACRGAIAPGVAAKVQVMELIPTSQSKPHARLWPQWAILIAKGGKCHGSVTFAADVTQAR